VARLGTTLAEHYAARRARYGGLATRDYDRDLVRLFASGARHRRAEPAARFLLRHRARLRRMVARGTGRREFALEVVLGRMIERCRELDLRAVGARRELLVDLAILLTARSEQYVYRARDRQAL
jgi:hypothetical protein